MLIRQGPFAPLSHRGRFFRFIWPVTNYITTHFLVNVARLYFYVFNRTRVFGKENIQLRPNVLFLSNHQSMIDSFLIGGTAFYPQAWVKPRIMPWNPAAEENFYRNKFLAWISDNLRCIPVKAGRKDVKAIFRMAEALKYSPMVLFPEGTRSRSGKIGRGRPGAGFLILETWPEVIPVCIDGMDKVLPIGKIFPRVGKEIYVYFGKPLDLSEFKSMEKNKETAQLVTARVMDAIRKLQAEIQEIKATKRARKHSGVFGKEVERSSK